MCGGEVIRNSDGKQGCLSWVAAFKEHMPNEPRWPNVGEKLITTDRRVYVATYPTMLNIIRDEAQHLSPHFFDFSPKKSGRSRM